MENTSKALTDFQAGSQAGAEREHERWMLFLQNEKLDIEEQIETTTTDDDDETNPMWLDGWRACLEYLINPSAPVNDFDDDDAEL